ncbi:OX-2 membrane glycoprotein [Bombina bombina]|uniref:OX-2 membrane glycoprotein n=1 Tax=Bombina bombina TaxID=8345 RepID=UPI00235B1E32|nr:OX-2 membrane glycoprotein [Bombina bombina]
MKILYLFCCLWYLVKGSLKVINMDKISATVGDNVTFYCQVMNTSKVLQVTWEKYTGNFTGPIATYSIIYGPKFLGYYSKRAVQFTDLTPNASAIRLNSVNLKDQGCFKCIFNVFPIGASNGRICLDVYESQISKPKLETHPLISPENTEEMQVVSCTATGKPAPEITWNLTESHQMTPQYYSIAHPDQSVTIISNFTWTTSRSQHKTKVACVVRHPSLDREIILIKFTGSDNSSPEQDTLKTVHVIIYAICITCFLCILTAFCFYYFKTIKYKSFGNKSIGTKLKRSSTTTNLFQVRTLV